MTLPFYLDLFLLIIVLTPLVAAVALVRSKRRARRDGVASTMWASAGLVVLRGMALLAVSGFVVISVSPGKGSTRSVGDGRIELESGWYEPITPEIRDGERLTISVLNQQPLELCPSTYEPVEGRPGVQMAVERRCWARRQLERYYDGVGVGDWTMVRQVVDPPASVGRTLTGLQLILVLGVGLILLSLERILFRTSRREPFAEVNVRWLQILAFGVGIVGIVHPMLEHRFTDALIVQHLGQTGQRAVASGDAWWWVGYSPFLVVLLILAVAEVWRFGIRLQEDAEATV